MNRVAHRRRVMQALGLTPWQRRQALPAPVAEAEEAAPAPGVEAACVVLLPDGCGTRELDLLGRALNCAGAALARAARLPVRAGSGDLEEVPVARAYLACGEAQAHALGRSLPMQVTAQAQIVLVDEPARLLREGGAKRRLWIALRTLRRHLRGAG